MNSRSQKSVTLGKDSAGRNDGDEFDSELARALDQLIIYLRLVYSIDFYAPALYPDESSMPHPCGVLHVRPSVGIRASSPPPLIFSNQRSAGSVHRVTSLQNIIHFVLN